MAGSRAVLYARVSKKDGEQDPETQLQTLRSWARERGWRVVAEQHDRVTGDPARRGRNPPGLVEALSLIGQHKAEVLAIFAADRLVRSPTHLLELIAQVQKAGGSVASLQDGADLDITNDTSELYIFLLGWKARMDLRLTRKRTIAGLERAKAEGKQLGRPQLGLPVLVDLQALLDQGVRGRAALAQRLSCSPWAVRKALDLLAKNGEANSGPVQTDPQPEKQAGE